jgi:hypothetical protein
MRRNKSKEGSALLVEKSQAIENFVFRQNACTGAGHQSLSRSLRQAREVRVRHEPVTDPFGCCFKPTDGVLAEAHVAKEMQAFCAVLQLHNEYTSLGFILSYGLRAEVEQNCHCLNETADKRS